MVTTVSVCLSVRMHISDLRQFFVLVTYNRGSILL